MTTYLIIGLQGSCTRYLSRLVAANTTLGEDGRLWDGGDIIEDSETRVIQRSLPYLPDWWGITAEYASTFDHVCLATRDYTCALLSKHDRSHGDLMDSINEFNHGIASIRSIVDKVPVHVWSYESAELIGDAYTAMFLRGLGLPGRELLAVEEANKKYHDFWG